LNKGEGGQERDVFEVATVNSNGTYDIYISGCDVAYPSIPTTLRNPDFSVGDAVEILIEYGNKELPIIIGLSKKIVQDITQIDMNVLVTTLDAYSITDATAYFKLRIDDIEGYENCTRYGFHYGTSTGYGSDVYEDGSFAVGYYNKQATGLTGETLYHFQAYVYDADGDEQTGGDKTLTTTTAPSRYYALIVTSPSEIQVFNTDGNLLNQLAVSGWSFAASGITMDSQGNIYLMENMDYIKKYDSDLNLLATEPYNSGNYWIESMAIDSDGYLYTLEGGADYYLVKRNLSDLTVVSSVTITDYGSYIAGKIAFDNNGNWYIKGDSGGLVCKYNKSGTKLGEIDVSDYYPDYHDYTIREYSGCGAVGNNVYFASTWNDGFIVIATNLSSCTRWELSSNINYGFCVVDNHIICSGWDGDNDGATAKYDSDRNLIWIKKLGNSTYAYKAGSYNF